MKRPRRPRPTPRTRLLQCSIVGSWCGGQRSVEIDRTLELANVWFHFGTDGEAVVSLRRPGDAKPRGVRGHWELRGRELVLETDGGTIAAPWSVAEGVLRWGTEVLVRIPDGLPPVGVPAPDLLPLLAGTGIVGPVA